MGPGAKVETTFLQGRRQLQPFAAPVRVLIVDDDEDFILVMRRLLAETGMRVTIDSVHDFQSGLRALDHHRYGVILSDFDLKVSTGLQILAHARRKQDQGLRILVTGTPGRVKEADGAVVHYLWDKSWDHARLLEYMRPMLRAAERMGGEPSSGLVTP